jgi:hypothetical protein
MNIKGKSRMLEIGSTRLHPMENSLWKRLRICRKTDYGMNEYHNTNTSSVSYATELAMLVNIPILKHVQETSVLIR